MKGLIREKFPDGTIKWKNRLGFTVKFVNNKRVYLGCVRCNKLKMSSKFPKRVRIARQNGNGSSKGIDRCWCNDCQKEFRQENQESLQRNGRRWHRNKIKQESENLKLWAKSYYHAIKHRAKKNNFEFDLTVGWIYKRLKKGHCEATGIKLTRQRTRYKKTKKGTNRAFRSHAPNAPTIDRKDNEKGYTKDNCWMVCWFYNRSKANHSHAIVVKFAKRLLEHEGFQITKPN